MMKERMMVMMKERMMVMMKERMMVMMKERMMVMENLSRNQNLEMVMVAMVKEEENKAAKVTAKRFQFYPLFAFFFLH
jgi:hypothetical protein